MIIKNNLIAITIHALLCVFSFFTMFLSALIGKLNLSFQVLIFSIFTLVILLFYFLLSRLFLKKTHGFMNNIFSVSALLIINIIGMLLAHLSMIFIFTNYSFFMIIFFIYGNPKVFEPIQMIIYWLCALLPSFAIWLGMITKKTKE